MFGPTYVKIIDRAIQQARGAAASVLGQTYDVYRLTNQTGQVVQGTPLYTNFPARKLDPMRKSVENTVFDIQVYPFTCDNTYLQIGDILVENGYGSDAGMYVYAQGRPTDPNFFVRVEQSATVTRPTTPASLAPLNPNAPTQIKSYVGVTKTTEQSLILTNGHYSFSTSGVSAMVPFGLQPLNKMREMPPSKLPTDTKREQFLGFLPLLGIIIEENDVISSGAAGDRYRIEQNYISEFGLKGQILILQKLTV